MGSSFRLADAVNSMTSPGTHHDLGCEVIPTIAITRIRFFVLECSFNGNKEDCYSTPGLLRGNEPGNESNIDSLCETLTGKITFQYAPQFLVSYDTM